jgi:hypothetical protein
MSDRSHSRNKWYPGKGLGKSGVAIICQMREMAVDIKRVWEKAVRDKASSVSSRIKRADGRCKVSAGKGLGKSGVASVSLGSM